ncbi:efflux RND transporter periplasmic adaptor subunit [Sulfitobacter sp.]|uniref:efflux RND transporter periplasmic adaptor subunit n=1 Tax=Sulfitobacter sp. TaxID=1903071 RepID=UPI0030013841
MTSSKIIILLSILGLGGAAFWSEYFRLDELQTTWITTEVSKDELIDLVTATGTLKAVSTVDVGPEISGRISSVLVDFNDRVEKGQTLLTLDRQSFEALKSEADATLKIAKAGVAVKQAELERAHAELDETIASRAVYQARQDQAFARLKGAQLKLDRNRVLSKQKLVPISEGETLETEIDISAAALREAEVLLSTHATKVAAAKADVARQEAALASQNASVPLAEATLSLRKVELERTDIKAPISGVVINKTVSAGQTVAASLETPILLTIALDLTLMELHASIDETDIGRIKVKQRVNFTVDAHPSRVYEGKVIQVRMSPEIIQNVVTYTVVISANNADLSLFPGMTAGVEIVVTESEPVLNVPMAAVNYRDSRLIPPVARTGEKDDSAAIWLLMKGEEPKAITAYLGIRNTSHIEITGTDLIQGDRVVVGAIERKAEGVSLLDKLGIAW